MWRRRGIVWGRRQHNHRGHALAERPRGEMQKETELCVSPLENICDAICIRVYMSKKTRQMGDTDFGQIPTLTSSRKGLCSGFFWHSS